VKQGEELKTLDCTIMYISEYIYTQLTYALFVLLNFY